MLFDKTNAEHIETFVEIVASCDKSTGSRVYTDWKKVVEEMNSSFPGDIHNKDKLVSLYYKLKYNDQVVATTHPDLRNEGNVYREKRKYKTFRIGIVSDTHLGSKYQQLTSLHEFYDYCQDQGIDTIYHAGDIAEGLYNNRPQHVHDRFLHTYDDALKYIVDSYPKREGIQTKFITGNHDYTFIMNGGGNMGALIEVYRPDMEYLGHNFAKVWLTPKVDLNLVHPGDGSAFSISLKAQQRIDRADGLKKCKIMTLGHYHKFDHVYWGHTHGITLPSFHGQSGFMEGRNLASIIGGVILTISVNDDEELESVAVEFKPFKEIRGDY